MSTHAGYNTPDDAPTGSICIQITIPSGDEWEALVRGALAGLLLPTSYRENTGALTPDETAVYFQEYFGDTFEWIECP